MGATMASGTVSAAEVARFDALAAQWWDPRGPMRPLHAMNPLRVGWIESRIRARFGQEGAKGGGAIEVRAGDGHGGHGLGQARKIEEERNVSARLSAPFDGSRGAGRRARGGDAVGHDATCDLLGRQGRRPFILPGYFGA